MEQSILFAASDLALIVKDTVETFGLDWPHFIAQVVSFCIVAYLLHRFAYKRILQVLEERRRRIAEGLANAEKTKQELAKTEAARQQVLQQAGTQANKLIEEARGAAARVLEQETQKAVVSAEQIVAKAREAAQQDYQRMLADLKKEVGRLVVEATRQVTGKILTTQDQQRLTEEVNRQLAA